MTKQITTLLGIVPVIESISDTITNSLDSISDRIKRSSDLENAKFIKELAELDIDDEVAEKAKKIKELINEMKELQWEK